MTFQTDIADVAYGLAQKYGDDVIFVVQTTTHDEVTGQVIVTSSVPTAARVTPPAPFEERLINGTTIKYGDCRVILPTKGTTIVPVMLQVVQMRGQDWKVMNLVPYASGRNETAAYELHLRSLGASA